MTDTTSSPAARRPTPQEIEAAARLLMRAWAPGYLLPGDRPKEIAAGGDDDYDEQDPDEYCGCAGTDDDGESLGCNCGGGCVCDECSYQAYAQYKRCWVKGCGKAPAFRVTRFRLVDQQLTASAEQGVLCSHAEGEEHWCTADTVWVDAGPSVQDFAHQPACSIAHAVELREGMQRQQAAEDTLYRIERWTYTPHDRELPAPLPALREQTRSARDATRYAIRKHATGLHDSYWLPSARQHLAVAVWNARLELEQPGEEFDVWDDQPSTPVQEEPSEPDEAE
jgi:hypothetical protein